MPNSFFISEFRLSYKYKELNILNLARPSQDTAWVIKNNYGENKEKDDIITEQCIGTLFLYILKAACSIIANDKNAKFIEEYTFPQLLLLWVRYTGKYHGIAYHTSSMYKSAPNSNTSSAYNVVFPSTSINGNNEYCSELKSMFAVTEPRKVVLSEFIGEKKELVDKVNAFRNELYYHPVMKIETINEIMAIISCCDMFNLIYDSIKNNKYGNLELPYEMLKTLYHVTCGISISNINKDIIIEKNPRLKYEIKNADDIIEQLINDTNNKLENILKRALRDFYEFAYDLEIYAKIDQKTLDLI